MYVGLTHNYGLVCVGAPRVLEKLWIGLYFLMVYLNKTYFGLAMRK